MHLGASRTKSIISTAVAGEGALERSANNFDRSCRGTIFGVIWQSTLVPSTTEIIAGAMMITAVTVITAIIARLTAAAYGSTADEAASGALLKLRRAFIG